jgi:hypothetical protein
VIRRILERADRPHEIVLVTSDKALYSFAKNRGASCLRAHEWNAQERRLRARPDGSTQEKPEREDDVAGWLVRFGADQE